METRHFGSASAANKPHGLTAPGARQVFGGAVVGVARGSVASAHCAAATEQRFQKHLVTCPEASLPTQAGLFCFPSRRTEPLVVAAVIDAQAPRRRQTEGIDSVLLAAGNQHIPLGSESRNKMDTSQPLLEEEKEKMV
ncbi:unnamed protein product [Lota lota]